MKNNPEIVAAIQQSYAQTEPLFVAHEYVLGQLYQAIIDASLYIEANKPASTVSYITSEGESAFVQVSGTDLKFNVAYNGKGNNDYVNKYYNVENPNVYTTTVTYTIEAQ